MDRITLDGMNCYFVPIYHLGVQDRVRVTQFWAEDAEHALEQALDEMMGHEYAGDPYIVGDHIAAHYLPGAA